MDKQTPDNSQKGKNGNHETFYNVTCHLKNKDFKWLKDDMGFFDLPETWDLEFRNDNQRPTGF